MAASKHSGPRRGSLAYRALSCLHALGESGAAGWKEECGFGQSSRVFDSEVIQQLLVWRLVGNNGELYLVTAAGLSYLGFAPATPVNNTPPASGPYVPPRLPLSARNRPALRGMRPGAFDYRDIPSVHAGKPVAYRSSITVEDEGATA